jgi:hypothetical protein
MYTLTLTPDQKEIYQSLWKSGGCVELAHTINSKHSVDEYEAALYEDDFVKYRDSLDVRFADNFESILLSEVYHTLEYLKANKDNDKLLTALSNHLNKIILHTKPIIERHAVDNAPDLFGNNARLEIIINDD